MLNTSAAAASVGEAFMIPLLSNSLPATVSRTLEELRNEKAAIDQKLRDYNKYTNRQLRGFYKERKRLSFVIEEREALEKSDASLAILNLERRVKHYRRGRPARIYNDFSPRKSLRFLRKTITEIELKSRQRGCSPRSLGGPEDINLLSGLQPRG
jgi:hypothetical protein